MHPVVAYLDLASGSMIVQAAIAGIVVVPVLLRNRIRVLFGRDKTPDLEAEPESPTGARDVPPDGLDIPHPSSFGSGRDRR